ncbi:MAG TPA: hypothetical protein VE223_08045, partial [Nitrososphaeraceae archaeon]|nr:hypothetical protein [Nitrososphaeraceae archaeon]
MLKVENQVEISHGQLGLYMKAPLLICFQFRAIPRLVQEPARRSNIEDFCKRRRNTYERQINRRQYRVNDIVKKFKSKYGEGEVKKYYTKFDVAVEVML